MNGEVGTKGVRFCLSLLKERARAETRDAWLWSIKARVAEHYLAMRARDEIGQASPSEELSEADKVDILISNPLLQNPRTHEAGRYRVEATPWLVELRARAMRFLDL